jgi:hypothetical protein
MQKNVCTLLYLLLLLTFIALAAHQLNWYRFIGRVLGKALYEGILVDVTFAGFFLAKVNYDVSASISNTDRCIVVRKAELPGRLGLA